MLRALQQAFERRYGCTPRIFRAPGRVNLIGEHTDYNDGFVLPIAINRSTLAAIAPRTDGKVHVASESKRGNEIVFNLDAPTARRDWSDYVQGVAVHLMQDGVRLSGAHLRIASDVPIGGGLSSSAALEVSSALAFLSLADAAMDRRRLALVCQRAENAFVGMQCGIMDQFVACFAERGHALLIDCRSLDYEAVPLPSTDADIVVCNSMVKHALASSAYNERRRECMEGVRELNAHQSGIRALRDVSVETFNRLAHHLPETIRRRCRHVVTENARVLDAVQALKNGDLAAFGRLMYESHESLRANYAVSCPELDFLVDTARTVSGVYGARMTGGGFGGCTVQLVRHDAVASFTTAIQNAYRQRFGVEPTVYVFETASAADEIGFQV
jgi:galactokinase